MDAFFQLCSLYLSSDQCSANDSGFSHHQNVPPVTTAPQTQLKYSDILRKAAPESTGMKYVHQVNYLWHLFVFDKIENSNNFIFCS